jgi:protein-S-isoprenylcysteine O-methyltransferase Ste14
MTSGPHLPWCRGARGEWYVVAQLLLIGLVFLGPRTLQGLPDWPAALARISIYAGAMLILAGSCLFLAALVRLGSNLTPLPCPRPEATLVRTGPYRVVRHPIYAAGILLAYGWALMVGSWLTLAYATVLLLFLDLKSAREERWLAEKFPDYPDYQRQVCKLIPFIH